MQDPPSSRIPPLPVTMARQGLGVSGHGGFIANAIVSTQVMFLHYRVPLGAY